MERLYSCCAGLDVHKQTVVACLLRPDGAAQPKEIQTFGTTTGALGALRDWLLAAGCTHVAMEATGSFWKPVYNILDGHCTLLVVNAAHMHAVPGRKTDVRDAEWIATLLQHGLLRASFIPSREQCALRDLTRTRTSLIDERTAAVNRLQQVLEDANIKLAGVATDILGKSGRDILAALLGGEMAASAMANLARGKLRRKRDALEQALQGRMSAHHRRLSALHREHIDLLDDQIAQLSAQIAERLRPYEATLQRLETIPGVGRRTAEVLAADMGLAMERFPSAGHLASWAGMCPGVHESAGQRKSGKRREGNKALRRALTEAARAAARTKKKDRMSLRGQYRRLVVRVGKKKAAVAVGHTILRLAYHLLTTETTYHEHALVQLDERRRAQTQRRALDQLKALGYEVILTPKEPAA
jgi:transposase